MFPELKNYTKISQSSMSPNLNCLGRDNTVFLVTTLIFKSIIFSTYQQSFNKIYTILGFERTIDGGLNYFFRFLLITK